LLVGLRSSLLGECRYGKAQCDGTESKG